MMPRHAAIWSNLTILLLSACGQSRPPADAVHVRHLAELKAITDSCGLPASSLQLTGDNRLDVRVPPNAKYESVDCALRMLKNSSVSTSKMSFIGNEAHELEKAR